MEATLGDRVDEFLKSLEREATDRERLEGARSSLNAAERAARLLTDHLDVLAADGVSFESLTSDDVGAFIDEIHALTGLDRLFQLTESASALLRLVDDGIVDGDAPRLRGAIERAESVATASNAAQSTARWDQEVDPGLVRVRCATCGARVIGRRRPATTWKQVLDLLADHQTSHSEADDLGGVIADARIRLREDRESVVRLGPFAFSARDIGDAESQSLELGCGLLGSSRHRQADATSPSGKRRTRTVNDRAAQWQALPVGTRFARRSDPSIIGEIVEDHGFLVLGRLYPFTGRGAPLSRAGGEISGTSENGWLTWIRLDE